MSSPSSRIKGKSLELTQKDSELQSVRDEMANARHMVKDAQAERDHEKEAFQVEKEDLICDLEQARAGEVEAVRKIAELEARIQKEIHWFKRVKYMQGYKDWPQGKPPRYPLEVDVAGGDEVDSVPLVSGVLLPLLLPR